MHNETHYDSETNINIFAFCNCKALQSSLQDQQSGFNYLSTTVEEMSKKAPSDISRKYQSEFEDIEARWKKISSKLAENCHKLEDHMTKLRKIQVIQYDFYITFYSCISSLAVYCKV